VRSAPLGTPRTASIRGSGGRKRAGARLLFAGDNTFEVFLSRNHKDVNNVFRLVNPVYDMETYIFEAGVFTKHAKYEENTVFVS